MEYSSTHSLILKDMALGFCELLLKRTFHSSYNIPFTMKHFSFKFEIKYSVSCRRLTYWNENFGRTKDDGVGIP